MSVQKSPVKGKGRAGGAKKSYARENPARDATMAWDSDDDILGDEDDDTDDLFRGEDGRFGGMSPPKTMQFHVPASRVVRTPAGEASRRIVGDLLLSAGGERRGGGDYLAGEEGDETGSTTREIEESQRFRMRDFGEGGGLGDDDSPSIIRSRPPGMGEGGEEEDF